MNHRIALVTLTLLVIAAGCGRTETTQATVVSSQDQVLISATPPAVVTTPVPLVRAKAISGSGRSDPFVALYGPPQAPAATPSKSVAVSSFPNIPTLPGFEGAPGASGGPRSIWDDVHVTGIVKDGGYQAIIEANGRSYIVRPGDMVADTFRVVAIGPDFVALATNKEQRRILLGG